MFTGVRDESLSFVFSSCRGNKPHPYQHERKEDKKQIPNERAAVEMLYHGHETATLAEAIRYGSAVERHLWNASLVTAPCVICLACHLN